MVAIYIVRDITSTSLKCKLRSFTRNRIVKIGTLFSQLVHSFPMIASTCSSGSDEARKMPEYGLLRARIR
jgi:hypothetical protein